MLAKTKGAYGALPHHHLVLEPTLLKCRADNIHRHRNIPIDTPSHVFPMVRGPAVVEGIYWKSRNQIQKLKVTSTHYESIYITVSPLQC
jgi:hypothetical protein